MNTMKKEEDGAGNPKVPADQFEDKKANAKAVAESSHVVPQAKPEVKSSGHQHHASNLISATLQKMFHFDNVSGQAKSAKSSKASSGGSESDEDGNKPDHSSVSTSVPQSASSAKSTTAPKLRFQKAANGTHVHNLSPRKTHRMQSLFKEFGLNAHVPVEEQQTHHVRPSSRNTSTEGSLAEKYGKCQEVIGRGAFGIVRIAHKTEPKVPGEKLFAVKEFKKRNNEPNKKYIKRLTSEFCISSSLQHINVIDTLDLLQDTQGNYCEVMEYCAGGDLYSLIVNSGCLETEEANCFFGQLINGVKYLHDNGVAHRDLKPENLLLTSKGCLKITDFGNGECFRMAWETRAHLSRGICGSEPYIAPEEFTEVWFDPRLVDVWACGIIYMGMITGRQLWRIAKAQEDNNFKVYLQARSHGETLAPFQGLCIRRRHIIGRIIEPNPKQRMTVEQITKDPWFAGLNICCKPPPNNIGCSINPANVTCGANLTSDQQMTNINNNRSVANMVL
ncbi:9396_t:CDS:2 [Ambispora leptoticha]|uniref:non-specific serine/threonine protein kinase n=1 Tax=Ambispora leptoticha TaxID=144679 RepID=A0A9N8ZCC1_9GLOM|nr:9396_t:CDS:2 [Ambispora leptoticha]